MNFNIITLVFSIALSINVFGQQPKYTFKKFVSTLDTTVFKPVIPKKDGPLKTFITTGIQIMDIDDDNTTYVLGNVTALLCIEGQYKNGERDGKFNVYVIDSLDHSKRFRIWQQTYSKDKLNGQWLTYTLKGTLTNVQNFNNDSLNGISRYFWIDSKTILEETDYFNGQNKRIQKTFHKDGKPEAEIPYENGEVNGTAKKYYRDGTLLEVTQFKNGEFHGVRKYYYPNGQLWIEQIYKEGKSWTVVANYTDKGQKRDAGTLKNGNGTLIFYDEDGSVREILTYVNGEEKR